MTTAPWADTRVAIVAGKGGVGSSTVAAAIGGAITGVGYDLLRG